MRQEKGYNFNQNKSFQHLKSKQQENKSDSKFLSVIPKYDQKPRTILFFQTLRRVVRIVLISTKKRVWYVPTENSMKL